MTNTENIINIHGFSKRFGPLTAVDGLDLQVQRGEIFGLLGPDGAGKTTTMRMLVGIMEPSGGEGTLLGYDLLSQREQIKREIGYMSQRFSLYGDLTVAENLRFFSEIYEIPRSERAEREQRMLDFSRLHPFVDRLAQNLSGGMKQKLALACTLMHTPSILFLDEPTTGVDPVSRRDFWKILYQLVAEGMTIVVSTPYMDEAERCSRLAMMDRGRILMVNTPDGIRATVTSKVIDIVISPQFEARQAISRLDPVESVQLFGDRLHALSSDPERAMGEIRRVAEREGLRLESMRVAPPSLEDAFVITIAKERASEGGQTIG